MSLDTYSGVPESFVKHLGHGNWCFIAMFYRDKSMCSLKGGFGRGLEPFKEGRGASQTFSAPPDVEPVSYTHLTLPTIYSV